MGTPLPADERAVIAARARRIVETLALEHPSRNGIFPERLARAAAFLQAEFRSLGYDIRLQDFTARGARYANILAELPGTTHTSAIILGAHYDTVLGTPGADDNASGVAGVLELARLMRSMNPAHTIVFAAFANEEPPFFHSSHMGSRHHAKQLRESGGGVLLMFALEMLGYAHDGVRQIYPFPGMRRLGRYPEKGNFIAVVGNIGTRKLTRIVRDAMREGCRIGVESLSAPGFLPPLFLSDHASYWRYGFPAVMVTDTAFLRNPHYHLPSDTPQTLNYEFLAEVVAGLFAAVLTIDRLDG